MSTPIKYGRVIKVVIQAKGGTVEFSNANLEIRFEVDFDDSSSPVTADFVEIYNLTPQTISRFAQGQTISVYAGYQQDYGLLTTGSITSIVSKYVKIDKITTFKFKEGVDYSGTKVTPAVADPAQKYYVTKRYKLKKPIKTVHTTTYKKKEPFVRRVGKKKVLTYVWRTFTKHTTTTTAYKTVKIAEWRKQVMVITFGKGIHASQIIARLTRILGIHLAECNLPRDKIYTSGFKVTGSIETKLSQVVTDCGAVMYWRRGAMVIRSIEVGNDERFILNESTGLVQPPEQITDNTINGWSVTSLLEYRITTGSIVTLQSDTVTGSFRVKDGKHYYDGNDSFTVFECESSGE